MRHSSRLTRFLRSLTALATVWCLGCDAFDPLVATLIPGRGAMMVCESEGAVTISAVDSAPEAGMSLSAPTTADADGLAACACGSCHAPAPPPLSASAQIPSLPQLLAAEPTTPPSVDRTPLVPPPQRLT